MGKRLSYSNFYDSIEFYAGIKDFIVESINTQLTFGSSTAVAIVLGSGSNAKIFQEINNEREIFRNVLILEHPRLVMQYQRKEIDTYIDKYASLFKHASKLQLLGP